MVFASITKLGGRFFGKAGSSAAAKPAGTIFMDSKGVGHAAPKSSIFSKLRGLFSGKPQTSVLQTGITPQAKLGLNDAPVVSTASAVKLTAKPAATAKPQISAEDRALLDKMDTKQDLSKLGKAKDDITVGTKASALANTTPEVAEPKKGGFFSNGLVQGIGGTLVGTLGLNALTSMFSGGGGSAEAAPAPAPAPAPAASSYDPYAAYGGYGVPGSIPNYF